MAKRYELDVVEFEEIADLLPKVGKRGRQWTDHKTVLNGMFWVLNAGAQWREMPERYGNWKTIYSRFSRWSRDGTFEKILSRLHLRLDDEGFIDPESWHVDSTNIRATRASAGARKKISFAGEDPSSKVYKNAWYKEKYLNPSWDELSKAQKSFYDRSSQLTLTASEWSMGWVIKILYRLGLVFLCMALVHRLVRFKYA